MISLTFEVRCKKIASNKIRQMIEIPTYGYDKLPRKHTPNMASADDVNGIPSLSSLVPPHGNDGYRYKDGLPQLFVRQNWPSTAAATGKHRHGATMMRRAFK